MSEQMNGATLEEGHPSPKEQAGTEQSQEAVKQEQPTEQKEQASNFVTLADAQRMIDEAVKAAEKRTRSYADRGRVRAEEAVQAVRDSVEKLKALGQNISDEEAQRLESEAARKAISEPMPQEDTGNTGSQTQDVQYIQTVIGPHDLRMQGKYGLELMPTDPEVSQIEITGDKEKDMASVEKAYLAKQTRLASNNNNNESEATVKAAVRAPVAGGAKPSVVAKSSKDYWRQVKASRAK